MMVVTLKVRNETLYTKVQNFTKATIELLEKIKTKEVMPMQQVVKYSFEKSRLSRSAEFKVDLSHFVFRHFKEISELSEFVNCAKYILNNPVTREAMGWVDKEGRPAKEVPLDLHYFHILYSFLLTYLNKVDKLSLEEEPFRKVYMKFEKYVYKSIISHMMTAPLQGFSGTVQEVDFGNRLKLRRISDSEKVAYLRMKEAPFGFSGGLGNLDVLGVQYTLETVYSHRKGTPINTSSCRDSFEDVMTTLRLYKSGQVDFNIIKMEAASWDPIGGTSFSSGFSRQGRFFRGSYELNESEKPDLLRLWRRIKSFKKKTGSLKRSKYLNIALRRFSFGIEEEDAENKMIDFFIAFEALCLPERDELTYRLSNRVAILLAEEDVDAEEIRKFMAKAYDLRSNIVHGKDVRPIKIDGKIFKLNDFVQTVEGYLRESLKSFIVLSQRYKNQQTILALLDRSLIDTKSKRKVRKMLKHTRKSA